jgi:hypothetical protein
MKYTIKWVDGGKICTVEIDCADGVSESIKLGLAVKVALKSGADLSSADLSDANLSGADLSCANLYGANLSGADLSDADLSFADLSGAKLYGADLSDADLSFADLSGAKLYGADLSGAKLYGADLSSALLSRADLSRAKIGEYTIEKLVARATRSDGYEFFGFMTDNGTIIRAGCRTMTPKEYRAHIAKEYPDTEKARETLDILDFINKRAKS